MKYTLTDKNERSLFYASINKDTVFVMYDKEIKLCTDGFSDAQAKMLVKIHHMKFSTGQKSDNELCQSPSN